MIKTKVLLADDHGLVLEGLRNLLEPEFEVVAMVENGKDLLAAAPQVQPDIIQLDISMPIINGLEAAKRIKQILPETKILFVTMFTDPLFIREAFACGASGYVLKQSASTELVAAIKAILKGQRYYSPLIPEEMRESLQALGKRPASEGFSGKLTERQRKVLQLITSGLTAKEIAESLAISVKTVEFHKSNIMKILGAKTKADLTKYALGQGIISL